MEIFVYSKSPTFRLGIQSLIASSSDPSIHFVQDVDLSGDDWGGIICVLLYSEISLLDHLLGNFRCLLIYEDDKADPWKFLEMTRGKMIGWGMLPLQAGVDELLIALKAIEQDLVIWPAEKEFPFAHHPTANFHEEKVAMVGNLTEREVEILKLIGKGLSNKQIAHNLGISENTVKFHISSLFSKMGVNNRAEAVQMGNELGFLAL